MSADSEASEKYVTDFAKFMKDEKLSLGKIYNGDERGVFWLCLPRNTKRRWCMTSESLKRGLLLSPVQVVWHVKI